MTNVALTESQSMLSVSYINRRAKHGGKVLCFLMCHYEKIFVNLQRKNNKQNIMITFLVSLALLVLGYVFYGAFVAKVFGVNPSNHVPSKNSTDGVDYVVMPAWKVLLIQFLNIAGLGPIFGAVMGAMYGPACFIWIVFGTIFAGAMHDFFSGMMSLRRNGASLPEIDGEFLGPVAQDILRVVMPFMLVMVCAVFLSGPAAILQGLVPSIDKSWWLLIIFAYYIVATLLPIDAVIGKIYPLFGILLIFTAVGILVALLTHWAPVPEITEGLSSRHPKGYPIFPMMFVSIACGAISGFHATQSPMMARCISNEKYGRMCFYGAMVIEGAVALIWAAAASSFWGSTEGLNEFVASVPKGTNADALAVNDICRNWLGNVGGVLAIIGVVAAPISTGDTALRSARLMFADMFKVRQDKMWRRIVLVIPMIIVVVMMLKLDFSIIWRYFAWSNQAIGAVTLWAISIYLVKEKKFFWIALIPAMFMTAVATTFLMYAPECGIQLPIEWSYVVAIVVVVSLTVWFFVKNKAWQVH